MRIPLIAGSLLSRKTAGHIRFRLIVALLLARCLGPVAIAQSRSSEPAATTLLQDYLAHDRDQPAIHYAFVDHHEDITYVRDKQTHEESYTAEQIFIAGMPYLHRLEANGKPLTGKALARENELYEKAVHERSGLTEPDRWKMQDKKTFNLELIPRDKLERRFSKFVWGRDIVNGHECWVLELLPSNPDAPADVQRHIRLWIDAPNHKVMRVWVEYLKDDGTVRKGTTLQTNYADTEDEVLPTDSRFDFLGTTSGNKGTLDFRVVSTDVYSNYRRFRTSVTLNPAHEVPPQ